MKKIVFITLSLMFLIGMFFVGCVGQKDLIQGAENTAASKTISGLTALEASPETYDYIIIDDSGYTKRISAEDFFSYLSSSHSVGIAIANLATDARVGGATCFFDNAGSAIDADTKCMFQVPYKHTLDSITLTTDETTSSASMTIDVWIGAAGGTTGLSGIDGTSAYSLFDTATEPAISTADRYISTSSFDTTPATTDIAANTYYIVNVDACAIYTKAVVSFKFTKKD